MNFFTYVWNWLPCVNESDAFPRVGWLAWPRKRYRMRDFWGLFDGERWSRCLRPMGTVGVGVEVGEEYRLPMVPKPPFQLFSSPAITRQSSKRPLFVQTPRQKAVFCRRIRDFYK